MVEDLFNEPENLKKLGALAAGTAGGMMAGYLKYGTDGQNESWKESLGEGFLGAGAAYIGDELGERAITDQSIMELDDYAFANLGYAVGDRSVEKIADYLAPNEISDHQGIP